MEKNAQANPAPTPAEENNKVPEDAQRRANQNRNDVNPNSTSRPTRPNNRSGPVSSTPRDFEGATPKIGGILTLHSENMTKKVNYDQFCEKLYIFIMNVFKNGDSVVEVTRNPSANIVEDFKTLHKPNKLTDEEKESHIETEIKKEEIKEFVKNLNTVKSNLKKIYSLVYGNCTEGVQTMLKADSDYEVKSQNFDYEWLFKKVKAIVSGLDTKVNLRVSLHSAMTNFINMKQWENKTNDDYLTRFKSMVETLKLAGGEHILVSKEMIGKYDLSSATREEINEEKQKFMVACFILRSDDARYKKILDDLKSSANRGRDEYPTTLTNAFDLLVRESGEYDTTRGTSPRFRPRRPRGGPRGGRGRNSFLFAQQG